jgi:hypothetical protein
MMMPKSPRNYFFHRQADSHYASNLNHKLSSVMRIEDKEKPAYRLGYANGTTFGGENEMAHPIFLTMCLISFFTLEGNYAPLPKALRQSLSWSGVA